MFSILRMTKCGLEFSQDNQAENEGWMLGTCQQSALIDTRHFTHRHFCSMDEFHGVRARGEAPGFQKAPDSQTARRRQVTCGVKLTLAPLLRSNWATLRFS